MIYVTVRSGTRTGALVGPFATCEQAEGYLQPAINAAREVDQWAHFFDYGTASIPGYSRPGSLNAHVGYAPADTGSHG